MSRLHTSWLLQHRSVLEALALAVFVSWVASALARPHLSHLRNGRVTIIDEANPQAFGSPFGIATIDRRGLLYPLFRCLTARGCYDLESIDWAPDGRRLAFSVTTVGATSSYNGIHILNVRTRSDRHLRWDGVDLDWSPDGKRLAYVEYARDPRPVGSIYVIDANGARRTPLRTGTEGLDGSPSWSPDGKRLVYETYLTVAGGESSSFANRSILVIGINGNQPRLLATHAAYPAWSPNGRTIAYDSGCGIRLVTPAGRDATPASHSLRCRAIGIAGRPIWSPDGHQIAMSNKRGVYVMYADGSHLRKLTTVNPTGIFGLSRATWQPLAP
jgi:Tol biopolymer transport system component